MAAKTLSIIIVSFNTAELTLQTLESVLSSLKKTPSLLEKTELFVVDNDSQDDSVKRISAFKKNQPKLDLTLIQSKKNLGFGVANNLALENSTTELVLFLNSDTIVQGKAIWQLVQAFKNNPLGQATADLSSYAHKLDRLGILSATLKNQDGSIQPQGGSFPNLASLFCHMTMLDDLPILGSWLPSTQHTGLRSSTVHADTESDHLHQQDWVAATAMMVRRQALNEIGSFDQNIFMYGEDVELCMRAKHHHWDIAIHPGAFVTHLGSASSSSKNAILGELNGYLYIWSKHKPHWQRVFARSFIRFGARLRRLVFGIIGDREKADIYDDVLVQLHHA